jgi:death on curing protein
MNFLTLDQIVQLHVLVVGETGGSTGIRDLEPLESVVGAQNQYVFGKETYTDPMQKAAALIRGIIGDHPFVDGNKRTALLTALTFLKINGVNLTIPQGDLENFAVQVAIDKLNVSSIANWLEKHKK